MFSKQFDIIFIGDITTDAFIHLKDAHINCKLNHNDCELCLPFGEKVPFESIKIIKAVGNAANASVTSSLLGLKVALITNIGDDQNGHDCKIELAKKNVDTSYVKENKGKATNYHFVLWYDVDRTILVNHIEYQYKLPKFPAPKWLYLTSVGANTISYHKEILEYLELNPKVKLAFQPGTYQIKLGFRELEPIFRRSDIVLVNKEEAEKILINSGKKELLLNDDPKTLLKNLYKLGPKIVVITDGPKGSYMFDGEICYYMPIYPDPRPPLERTGCGDAWAATFVSAIVMGKSPLESLIFAPVNPMSVSQFIGSQEGLLTMDQIKWWLERAPENYKPKEI